MAHAEQVNQDGSGFMQVVIKIDRTEAIFSI